MAESIIELFSLVLLQFAFRSILKQRTIPSLLRYLEAVQLKPLDVFAVSRLY